MGESGFQLREIEADELRRNRYEVTDLATGEEVQIVARRDLSHRAADDIVINPVIYSLEARQNQDVPNGHAQSLTDNQPPPTVLTDGLKGLC